MQRTRKKAVAFSSYITEECLRLIEYLSVREEVTQIVFIRRAVKHFLKGDKKVDPRIMIRARKADGYIRRNALLTGYIDKEQKKILTEIAEEQGANFSQVFFQCMISYCALLISLDDTGIEISKKE